MKADDLKINELIEFSEDSLNLKGRRLAIHDVHAFALFRKDLIDSIGVENTRRILTRFGYFWGQADAAAMQRIFKWEDTGEWIMSASKLLAFQGSARTQIKIVKLDKESKTFHLEFLWYNSCEVEGHTAEIGKGEYPVCWILTGYASVFVSYCLQQNIYFVEKKCRGKGDRVCCATGMDESSWGDELKQFHNYFEHEDIIGKVKYYTEELKKRDKELEQERKKLKLLGGNYTKNDFIEVRSKSFQNVMEVAQRVARFDTSVLIKGESGTGKENIARIIHYASRQNLAVQSQVMFPSKQKKTVVMFADICGSTALYDKLERVVLPLFYGDNGRFIDVMRHAIALNGSFFNTQRMMQQYVLKAYFE